MTSLPAKPRVEIRRRWILWILLVVFIWLVVSNLPGLERFFQILSMGRWQWILAAILTQGIYYIVYSGVYLLAFEAVDVKSRLQDLLPVVFGSIFVNVAAPTGGASGAALFIDDAAKRGQSAARAAAGTLLVMIANLAAFSLVLLGGLAYLSTKHNVQPFELIGAAILLLVSGGLSGMFLFGLRRPSLLQRWLGWIQSRLDALAARLKREPFLSSDWAEKNAADFSSAALAIGAHPSRLLRTLLAALCAYLINLISLQFLFIAFFHPIHFGTLVAGFSVGLLFAIISIPPQGIGVVEGILALAYASLGVPASVATVVALGFRGITFWIPMAAGFFTLRRLRTFAPSRRAASDQGSVQVAAILTALMGLINLFSAVTPNIEARLARFRNFLPLEVRHGTHLTSVLAGFVLILLASNLWRRKRVAWLLTLIVLAVSFITHVIKFEIDAALFSIALALWLYSLRDEFHAHSDPPSIWSGIKVLGLALAFTLIYGAAGFYMLDRHFSVHYGLNLALIQTIIMFTQYYDPGLLPITGFGRYFADSIYMVGAATTGYAFLMIVRPVLLRQQAGEDQRTRAQQTVAAFGRSSLARFTLFPDKAYFFSNAGTMLAFVAKGRIALVLGDPIGSEGDFSPALDEFKQYCQRNDWQPAFYQVLPDHLPEYQRAGFSTLCIGHEAIVTLSNFTLEGSAAKPLRNIYNKITRLGYEPHMYLPPHRPELIQELRAISDEWLTSVHGTEKRFSLGWFDEDYLAGSPIIAVQAEDGSIKAFANVIPEYQRNEIAVDMMRRRNQLEAGTMDFLFISLLQWAQQQGYDTFNLGLSALAGVGERQDDPAVERALHYIFEHVNQFYNFKGLHAFKEKFSPQWSPRYLIYPSPASLPAIAMALMRADSGDDFLWGYLKS